MNEDIPEGYEFSHSTDEPVAIYFVGEYGLTDPYCKCIMCQIGPSCNRPLYMWMNEHQTQTFWLHKECNLISREIITPCTIKMNHYKKIDV